MDDMQSSGSNTGMEGMDTGSMDYAPAEATTSDSVESSPSASVESSPLSPPSFNDTLERVGNNIADRNDPELPEISASCDDSRLMGAECRL